MYSVRRKTKNCHVTVNQTRTRGRETATVSYQNENKHVLRRSIHGVEAKPEADPNFYGFANRIDTEAEHILRINFEITTRDAVKITRN